MWCGLNLWSLQLSGNEELSPGITRQINSLQSIFGWENFIMVKVMKLECPHPTLKLVLKHSWELQQNSHWEEQASNCHISFSSKMMSPSRWCKKHLVHTLFFCLHMFPVHPGARSPGAAFPDALPFSSSSQATSDSDSLAHSANCTRFSACFPTVDSEQPNGHFNLQTLKMTFSFYQRLLIFCCKEYFLLETLQVSDPR